MKLGQGFCPIYWSSNKEFFVAHVIEFVIFFLKVAVIVIAVLIILSNIIAASMKVKSEEKSKVKFKNKSKEFRNRKNKINLTFMDPKSAKKQEKTIKKEEKTLLKKPKTKNKLFVLNFTGDIKASQGAQLSDEISNVLEAAKQGDQVLVKLESPGGMVSGYGLAASELKRVKDSGIKLNVAVDKVAASGGYMMACVADHIMAAPFAVIGSIGVVAQMPNFNKLLKKNNIDYEVLTAGEYKRTLTVFGENTDEGRNKFKGQLEDIHVLFKNFVQSNRPNLDISKVATGEYWFGEQCLDLKLIDSIGTSEDFIFKNKEEFEIFEVSTQKKKSFVEKFSESASQKVVNKLEDLSLWNGL